MQKAKIDKEEFMALYNAGKNDVEMGKIFGVSCSTIANRRKEWGLKSKFEYPQSVSESQLREYAQAGLTTQDIAKETGIDDAWIHQLLKRYNIPVNSRLWAKETPLTQRQKEILVGTLLGDGTLRRPHTNANGKVEHSLKQYDYCKWKFEELKSLTNGNLYTNSRFDIRTSMLYEHCYFSFKSNPALNPYYEMFYPNGKKTLSEKVLDELTPLGLAVWFMDDGCKTDCSYSIATMSFDNKTLIKSMFDKFNLEITIQKSNKVYVKAKSAERFLFLIEPYLHETMLYKTCHVIPLNGEHPKKGYPVLNLIEI